MTSRTQPVILYDVPFSQPVREVMWLMLYKQMPFEMVLINPGSKGENGSRHPAYLAKNPGGTILTIEERDTGFVLGEAHAIMCYLSNKHGWKDVYPADHQLCAKVDWYLRYHHRNVRVGSRNPAIWQLHSSPWPTLPHTSRSGNCSRVIPTFSISAPSPTEPAACCGHCL